MSASPFVLEDELNLIHPVSPSTRWRQEKAGQFPKRIKISARKVAWRRTDIESWQSDPARWSECEVTA